MKDFSHQFRKISKFIVELRFEPKFDFLDKKGAWASTISERYSSWFNNVQLINNELLYKDNLRQPNFEFSVGYQRVLIIERNSNTFEEFQNKTKKLIKLSNEIHNPFNVLRLGFRIIAAYKLKDIKSFNDACLKIDRLFLTKSVDFGLDPVDLMIKFEHKNGFYVIGPIKEKENWINNNLGDSLRKANTLKFGYGLDIDSFIENVDTSSYDKLLEQTLDIIRLGKAIEDALTKSLE
jgi:hypothetical protein